MHDSGGRVTQRRGRRGQTTLDFAVGVSLFLIIFIAIFIFVPGTLQPFAEGGQEKIVATNRVANSLSEGLLGDPSQPHVLNRTCTVAFFESGPLPPAIEAGCAYSGATLTERLGVKDRIRANVTIRSNLSTDSDGQDVLCWDASASELVEQDNCPSGNTELRIGKSPPQTSGTAIKGRRIVDINGTDATLIVEVW